MTPGLFITFESIDGLGKSTQMKLLGRRLAAAGRDIFYTKEPGDATMGSAIGAGVRDILFKQSGTKNLHPGVAEFLFLADHLQTSGDVAEAMARGQTVLCDRYADSQFAYAEAPSKRCPEWSLRYHRERYGIVPDITVLFLAIPNEDGIAWALERAQRRRGVEAGKQDGKAWNNIVEQEMIQNAYARQLSQESRSRFIPVREADSIEEIHERVFEEVFGKNFTA